MHESPDHHVVSRILQSNEESASQNQLYFEEQNTCVFNIMSAPGAGKTTLLEATFLSQQRGFDFAVLEGDMAGTIDADRLARLQIPVHQISTGRSCHLDAQMVARVVHQPVFHHREVVFIENVGNLVCPAEFPLGEYKRVVLLSVTEGDDKPLKYPVIFRNSDVVVLSKVDLMAYVDFERTRFLSYLHAVNPGLPVIELSAKSGLGMSLWFDWLNQQLGAWRCRADVHHNTCQSY